MTATIAGYRSRAQLKMRAPKTISKNINPKQGGSAVHYGGSTPNPAPTDHAKCESTWRSWQNYHMDSNGWADIAYTAGYCNHGYVLAGRGYGVRTAANGTNDANYKFYAFCWIGGGNASVSQQAKDALEWLVVDARAHGNAGMQVKPHKTFYSTSCPGTTLTSFAATLDGKSPNIPPPPAAPKFPYPSDNYFGPESSDPKCHSGYYTKDQPYIKQIQSQLTKRGWSTTADGKYGSKTATNVKSFQTKKQLSADGLTGPNTWTALWKP